MKIAVAATASDTNAEVSMHGARAPFYLVYDAQGILLDAISNPFSQVAHGAGLQVARFLAELGISKLVAGDFGQKFMKELMELKIEIVTASGVPQDIIQELI